MFLPTIADGKAAASWGEEKRNCKDSPCVRFWMGPNWVGPWALFEVEEMSFQSSHAISFAVVSGRFAIALR